MLDFNSVLVGSADPQKLTEFYTEIIGKPAFEDGGFTGFQVGSGWLMVGPHSDVKGRNKEPGRIILNFETADVKGEFKRIKDLGAKVQAEPYNPGGNTGDMLLATFVDPDGNYFQLCSPMPAEMP
jgi:predicted enzyme related to lactoylglutathione lyase